jgi:hypothetical protein
MGGFGNNLFQIDHGLSQTNKKEEVEFITNLIDSPIYSKLFRWTYHPYIVEQKLFKNKIALVKLSAVEVLYDLFCLMLVKFFNFKFKRIGWNTQALKKVNFGYYQFCKTKPVLSLNNNFTDVDKSDKVVVHLRLGDSPNLISDLLAQTKLMQSLKEEHYLVLTNDIQRAESWFSDKNLNITVQQNSVIKDFTILSNAEILIGPQSTFSWMAAFLSNKVQRYYVHENLWKLIRFKKDITVTTYS